jgi:hypothetical protein
VESLHRHLFGKAGNRFYVIAPVVKAQYLRLPPEKPDLLTKDRKDYVIRLKEFRSDTLASSPEDFENYETLSMVLVDFAFNGKVFDMDVVYWVEDLSMRS